MRKFFDANKSYIISSILFLVIFSFVFYIYRLKFIMLIYGSILYFGIVIPIMFNRYFKFKKVMKNIYNDIMDEDFSNLIYDNSLLERGYFKIYKEQEEENTRIYEEFNNLLKEQQEYLTLWVHQVKTPISSIELFTNREENETNRDIKRELLKANEYIDQMINYMKLNKYSEDYVFNSINLNKIINNTIKKYKLLFFQKKLYIKLDIEDIDIVSDEKWLNYVFGQIIFNSLKYTDTGGLEIFTEKDNPFIIHILDTGIGIPSGDLGNLTKWGYTGENGRLDKNSTGIGLYLVDKILKKFRYEYEIKSELGKGTEFIINLKRKDLTVDKNI